MHDTSLAYLLNAYVVERDVLHVVAVAAVDGQASLIIHLRLALAQYVDVFVGESHDAVATFRIAVYAYEYRVCHVGPQGRVGHAYVACIAVEPLACSVGSGAVVAVAAEHPVVCHIARCKHVEAVAPAGVGYGAHIVQLHSVASAHRAGVDHKSVDKHIFRPIYMTSLVAALRTCYASTHYAHILCIVDGECGGEVAATLQIDCGVRFHTYRIAFIQSRGVVAELASHAFCLFPCLVGTDGRSRREEQQVVLYVAVQFHAHVLGLEQDELHRRVVLHVGYRATVVGAYACRLKLLRLAHHAHKHIAREVEHGVGYLCHPVAALRRGCIHLGHIRVDACPFLPSARLHKNLVVVFQRCPLGCLVGIYLMQARAFLHPLQLECPRFGAHVHLATLLGLCLFGQQPLGVRHLQSLAANIVAVGLVVYLPYPSASHLARRCPARVESGAVGPCLERHIISHVVACRVFDASHQSVVERSPQVVALLPCHLTYIAHHAKTQLGVVLVASRLLTLARGTDVAWQRTVVVGMEVVVDRCVIHLLVVEQYATRHAQAVDYSTPVAVSIRAVGIEFLNHRQQRTSHHLFPFGCTAVAQQRHGPHQVITLNGT